MEAVARACHELRGPLAAARLGLELGVRVGELSPAQLRALELELGRASLALDDGTAWVALDDGVARVKGDRATLTDLPGVRAVVAGGRRIWALSDSSLFRLDPASGRVLGRSLLRQLQPVAVAAGAGADGVAGSRDGRPRCCGSTGRRTGRRW